MDYQDSELIDKNLFPQKYKQVNKIMTIKIHNDFNRYFVLNKLE